MNPIIDKEKMKIYSDVFDNDAGRKVIQDLVNFTGFFGDTFTPNDPSTNAYCLGQRRILLRILKFVGEKHAIDMVKDHAEKGIVND